ncbi:MAG: hypothetical protein H7315_13125 [Herminiimonas sp.]|nr:hypothetical protein [Herminiimonas sp.]
MSRPTFSLSDDQARVLRDALPPILERHPPGAASHRPFVREFVRAVHAATGQTYGASIYRRLLDVYAPGRSPSTDTLASEKAALDAALDQEARAGRQIDDERAEDLAGVIARAVETALARQPIQAMPHPAGGDTFLLAQCDFLQTRLIETEQALNQTRAHAARQAADVQAAHAVRETLQNQIDAMNTAALAQSARIEQLTTEVTGMRLFAMRAIEASRGETRAQHDRAVHLESLLKAEKEHAEVFKRLAYRNGAAIPVSLQPEIKK